MAGDTNPGRNMWVAVGIQTSMTTIATLYSFHQPTEVGGFLEEFAYIDSNRRLGTRFQTYGYLGTKQVPFSFTVEANPDVIGRILAGAIGFDSLASATSVAHNHNFKFNVEELPYLTILGYLAGVADASATAQEVRIRGCKINTMTIAGGIDNVMTLTIDGIGMSLSAATTATTAYSSSDPWFLNSMQGTGILSVGSTVTLVSAFQEVRDFELTIENGITADHRIHGSATPVAISEGSSRISGRMTAVFNPETFAEINNYRAGNLRALTLTATGATAMAGPGTNYKTLAIGLSKFRYTGDTPSWDPDVMTVDLPFTCEASVSTYINVLNDCSTAYASAT